MKIFIVGQYWDEMIIRMYFNDVPQVIKKLFCATF